MIVWNCCVVRPSRKEEEKILEAIARKDMA